MHRHLANDVFEHLPNTANDVLASLNKGMHPLIAEDQIH
jgi:hypothetical protein